MISVDDHLKTFIQESISSISSIENLKVEISSFVQEFKKAIDSNKKILIAGNGGLAAEAEHFCGELTCTFKSPTRRPISAVSLTSSASAITAWANDFGFDSYFTRMVDSLGSEGDILVLMSTSGGDIKNKFSLNLYDASKRAKEKNMKVISIVGKNGGALIETSDIFLHIKSNTTAHVQEATLVICHLICDILDEVL